MPEYRFIENCSPTLAGLKTGSMFSVTFKSCKTMCYFLFKWNRELNSKGVYVTVLRKNGLKTFFYVFRFHQLKNDLTQPDTTKLLSSLGYNTASVSICIKKLSSRIKHCSTFPHEVGLFLGYPLVDVIGFIKNKGQNSLYSGYWKVYGNQSEAQKRFNEYKKCKEIYTHMFFLGSTVSQLAAAVL